ncbi:MAG: signal peptidase I [Bacteroidales bacterium]|jgi:signal peptidase I|nr:signal peptidase I [Bacteroidales bacterium]
MKYIIIFYPIILGALFYFSPRKRWLRAILTTVKVVGSLVLMLLLLRLYCFDIFKIPSASMEQTLMVGDKIIIHKNKLPHNNDMVVFEMKHWDNPMIIVKRCIGVPGDSLSLRRDSVFINGLFLPEPETLQHAYDFDSCHVSLNKISEQLEEFHNVWSRDQHKYISFSNHNYSVITSTFPSANLQRTTKAPYEGGNAYPWKWHLRSNWNNIKPFYIPKKGMSTPLNRTSIAWYADIIKLENDSVIIENGSVKIDSVAIKTYTFKNNYYYMMGDNRDQSMDSRWWGFVPEDCIYGKVLFKISSQPLLITKVQ